MTNNSKISNAFRGMGRPLASAVALSAIILPVAMYSESSAEDAKSEVLDTIAAECSAYRQEIYELYKGNPEAALQKLIDDGGRIETTKGGVYGIQDSYKIASTAINPNLSKLIEDLKDEHANRYNRNGVQLSSAEIDCNLNFKI